MNGPEWAAACALRLNKGEHAHRRDLTRSGDRRAFTRETVREAIQRLVASLKQPAYVTGRRWDILMWNNAAAEIFAFARLAVADRNNLICVLTKPASRRLFGAAWADDPAFLDLLHRLREGCPEFSGWWGAHDIRGAAAGRKRLKHPRKGMLMFEHTSFQANDDPALKLIVYTTV